MKYDIFISYRREGGYDTAKHLNDLLVRDGYKVSFDIDTLRSGNFDTQLLDRIEQCKDFILIVDQHCFDRTLDPDFEPEKDWLRCELSYALKKDKNIVPIILSDVKGFPDNLPKDVAEIVKKNGPEYNRYHFNAFYRDLKKRFLHPLPFFRNSKVVYVFASFALLISTFILYNIYNTGLHIESSTIESDSIQTNSLVSYMSEIETNSIDAEVQDPFEYDPWEGMINIEGGQQTNEVLAKLELNKTNKNLYSGTINFMLGHSDDVGRFVPELGILEGEISASYRDSALVVVLGKFSIEKYPGKDYELISGGELQEGKQIFRIKYNGDGKYYPSEDGEEPIKKPIFEAKALGKMNGFYWYMAGIEVTKYD